MKVLLLLMMYVVRSAEHKNEAVSYYRLCTGNDHYYNSFAEHENEIISICSIYPNMMLRVPEIKVYSLQSAL